MDSQSHSMVDSSMAEHLSYILAQAAAVTAESEEESLLTEGDRRNLTLARYPWTSSPFCSLASDVQSAGVMERAAHRPQMEYTHTPPQSHAALQSHPHPSKLPGVSPASPAVLSPLGHKTPSTFASPLTVGLTPTLHGASVTRPHGPQATTAGGTTTATTSAASTPFGTIQTQQQYLQQQLHVLQPHMPMSGVGGRSINDPLSSLNMLLNLSPVNTPVTNRASGTSQSNNYSAPTASHLTQQTQQQHPFAFQSQQSSGRVLRSGGSYTLCQQSRNSGSGSGIFLPMNITPQQQPQQAQQQRPPQQSQRPSSDWASHDISSGSLREGSFLPTGVGLTVSPERSLIQHPADGRSSTHRLYSLSNNNNNNSSSSSSFVNHNTNMMHSNTNCNITIPLPHAPHPTLPPQQPSLSSLLGDDPAALSQRRENAPFSPTQVEFLFASCSQSHGGAIPPSNTHPNAHVRSSSAATPVHPVASNVSAEGAIAPFGAPRHLSAERPSSRSGGRTPDGTRVPLQLAQLRGCVVKLVSDQHGCRALQSVLEHNAYDSPDVQCIIAELCPALPQVMTNPYGNFLVQKLLEIAPDAERLQLLSKYLSSSLCEVAISPHGNYAVQKLIDSLRSTEEAEVVCTALRRNVLGLMKDLNGGHVVQKLLQCLPQKDVIFLYDAIVDKTLDVCNDKQGCCIVQKCIDGATPDQRRRLQRSVLQHLLPLAMNAYGNYVVTHLVKHCGNRSESYVVDEAAMCAGPALELLCTNKFASNVVETIVQHCGERSRVELCRLMLQGGREDATGVFGFTHDKDTTGSRSHAYNYSPRSSSHVPSVLRTIALHSYGNYVVQTLLSVLPVGGELIQLLHHLQVLQPELGQLNFGKRVGTRMEEARVRVAQHGPSAKVLPHEGAAFHASHQTSFPPADLAASTMSNQTFPHKHQISQRSPQTASMSGTNMHTSSNGNAAVGFASCNSNNNNHNNHHHHSTGLMTSGGNSFLFFHPSSASLESSLRTPNRQTAPPHTSAGNRGKGRKERNK